MTKDDALPPDVRAVLERLQRATKDMPALEVEVAHLEHRLQGHDLSAVHLGIRLSAEAMLRHASKVENIEVTNGQLQTMQQDLKTKLKGRVGEDGVALSDRLAEFWNHLATIQTFANRNTHHQANNIYQAPGLQKSDPWSEVRPCLDHLASMALEFVRHWPPPKGVVLPEPGKASVGEGDKGDPTEPPPGPAAGAVVTDQIITFVGDMNAKQALGDDEARLALESITGMTRSGVTRRLNAAHGSMKVRNVFPEHFAGPRRADAGGATVSEEVEEGHAFDYESIGNLTISQARQYELGDSIARLTGLADSTVKRRLRDLNGNGVVRRQFSWYESATIGELTARTALDYRMAPLLARHLGRQPATIAAKLREAAGQTKLRTLFPELET